MKEAVLNGLRGRDYVAVRELMNHSDAAATAAMLRELDPNDRLIAFRLLGKDLAASVFDQLDHDEQRDLLELAGRAEAIRILEGLEPEDRVRLLDELPARVAKRLVAGLTPESRESLLTFMNYPAGSVGRLMSGRYIAVRDSVPAAAAIDRVRDSSLSGERTQTLYVVDATRHYMGMVHVTDLLRARPDSPVGALAERRDLAAETGEDQESAARRLVRSALPALPVVDREGRLVGVLGMDDALEVLEREESESTYRRAGLGDITHVRETLRSERLTRGPILYPVRVRLAFLMVTLAGGLAVGGLIEQFEDVLASVVAVAVFVPLVMDMGGNVGTQSTTIFARGLALGHISLGRIWRHIFREVRVGLAIGLIVGVLAGTVAYFWQGVPNDVPQLGLAVGIALTSTVTIASFLGFLLPWVMLKLGLDHAPGADPFMTTIKDFSGLFIYFALCAWVLNIA